MAVFLNHMSSNTNSSPSVSLERHPFAPWIPEGAKVLIMGTFPPGRHRWAMDFYYPNRTNDFWRVMGLIFESNKDAFYDPATKNYRLENIKKMLIDKGIAMSDTGASIRRLKGNASDKFLEIVEPVNIKALLDAMPSCRAIATTGEKAAEVLASLSGTPMLGMGSHTLWTPEYHSPVEIWRLPSTSRAYPMPPEKKAEYYQRFLSSAGVS